MLKIEHVQPANLFLPKTFFIILKEDKEIDSSSTALNHIIGFYNTLDDAKNVISNYASSLKNNQVLSIYKINLTDSTNKIYSFSKNELLHSSIGVLSAPREKLTRPQKGIQGDNIVITNDNVLLQPMKITGLNSTALNYY